MFKLLLLILSLVIIGVVFIVSQRRGKVKPTVEFREPENHTLYNTKKHGFLDFVPPLMSVEDSPHLMMSVEDSPHLMMSVDDSPHLIPKIVIQNYSTKNLPNNVAASRNRRIAENPGFSFLLFDEEDCDWFVSSNYGLLSPERAAYHIGDFKAEIFKLCALDILGGTYLSTKCKKPLAITTLYNQMRIGYQKLYVDENFMISEPRNLAIKSILNKLCELVLKNHKNTHPTKTVGLKTFSDLPRTSSNPDEVLIVNHLSKGIQTKESCSSNTLAQTHFLGTRSVNLDTDLTITYSAEDNRKILNRKSFVIHKEVEYEINSKTAIPSFYHNVGQIQLIDSDVFTCVNITNLDEFVDLRIPFKIFQTHKSQAYIDSNKTLQNAQNTWKNTAQVGHGTYEFYDNEQMDVFMKNEYPEIYEDFSTLPLMVMKADLWRYCIIYKYGGIYADADTECLVNNVFKVLLNYNTNFVTVLENEHHFCQWVFAAKPGCRFLKNLIDLCMQQIRKGIDLTFEHFVHECTGPLVFTAGIEKTLLDLNLPVLTGTTNLKNGNTQIDRTLYDSYPVNSSIKILPGDIHSKVVNHLFSGQWADGWWADRRIVINKAVEEQSLT
jgi:mannosyltransferase OCH1-like enzyme